MTWIRSSLPGTRRFQRGGRERKSGGAEYPRCRSKAPHLLETGSDNSILAPSLTVNCASAPHSVASISHPTIRAQPSAPNSTSQHRPSPSPHPAASTSSLQPPAPSPQLPAPHPQLPAPAPLPQPQPSASAPSPQPQAPLLPPPPEPPPGHYLPLPTQTKTAQLSPRPPHAPEFSIIMESQCGVSRGTYARFPHQDVLNFGEDMSSSQERSYGRRTGPTAQPTRESLHGP